MRSSRWTRWRSFSCGGGRWYPGSCGCCGDRSSGCRCDRLRPGPQQPDPTLTSWNLINLSVLLTSSHFAKSGFNLHIFLKERFKASNLDIVVCEKSLPYSFPIASPTSPCVYPSKNIYHTYKNIVNQPNLILFCLNIFENSSSSSRSAVSSGGISNRGGCPGPCHFNEGSTLPSVFTLLTCMNPSRKP